MIIFTRSACLGGAATHLKFGDKHHFHSQGKVRVDFFMDLVEERQQRPSWEVLDPMVVQRYMSGVYEQQCLLSWLEPEVKPSLIIVDSYSETTDKRFNHRSEPWSFCGLYGDVDHELVTRDFHSGELLAVDEIEGQYDRFFAFAKQKWNVPIIYLHFPNTQEDREIYLKQSEVITRAMEVMARKHGVQNIHAEPGEIEPMNDGDNYHYSERTARSLANQIKI